MSDSEDDEIERVVKIAVLGDSGTGKTTLCRRYVGVSGELRTTQGAEVLCGTSLAFRPPVSVHMCDVSGQALNSNMLQNYLYGCQIVIFVYDVTNLQSFEHILEWLTRVKVIFGDDRRRPLEAIFGNKSDMEHQRAVRLSDVRCFATENDMECFIGSGFTGDMVEPCMTKLISRSLKIPLPKQSNQIQRSTNGSSSNTQAHASNGNGRSSHIMNRTLIRKIRRKELSNVCNLQ